LKGEEDKDEKLHDGREGEEAARQGWKADGEG